MNALHDQVFGFVNPNLYPLLHATKPGEHLCAGTSNGKVLHYNIRLSDLSAGEVRRWHWFACDAIKHCTDLCVVKASLLNSASSGRKKIDQIELLENIKKIVVLGGWFAHIFHA